MFSLPKKHHVGFACVVFALLTCSACNKVIFPHAAPVKSTWKTAIVYDSTIPLETQQNIAKELDLLYINSRTTVVKFAPAKDTSDADMIISVGGYKPGAGEQTS